MFSGAFLDVLRNGSPELQGARSMTNYVRKNGDDSLQPSDLHAWGEIRLRPAELLPLIRAAMARGEGPPAVLLWIRRQGEPVTRRPDWTRTDEVFARILAARLARRLNERWRSDAATHQSDAGQRETEVRLWQRS